jgi:hypothetical protein
VENSSWIAAILGFFGALAGGTLSAIITARGFQRQRLEDAYAEFAGATTLLLHTSIPAIFAHRDSDDAWVRFGTCRARLLLQQQGAETRAMVQRIWDSVEDLYSFDVRPDEDVDAVDAEQERLARATAHGDKMERVVELLTKLLTDARDELDHLRCG